MTTDIKKIEEKLNATKDVASAQGMALALLFMLELAEETNRRLLEALKARQSVFFN